MRNAGFLIVAMAITACARQAPPAPAVPQVGDYTFSFVVLQGQVSGILKVRGDTTVIEGAGCSPSVPGRLITRDYKSFYCAVPGLTEGVNLAFNPGKPTGGLWFSVRHENKSRRVCDEYAPNKPKVCVRYTTERYQVENTLTGSFRLERVTRP